MTDDEIAAYMAQRCQYPACVAPRGHGGWHCMSGWAYEPDKPPPTMEQDMSCLNMRGYAKYLEPHYFEYLRDTYGEDPVRGAICRCAR